MEIQALLKTLEELKPSIRARSAEFEKARQLPQDLVDTFRRARALSLQIPRALGGIEAEPAQILEAVEKVASADGSAGWCFMVANMNSGAAGYSPEAGAREVFTDPSIATAGAFSPGGAAVRTDGGYRISGRWPFATGITHSPWTWVGCIVMENGQPKMTPHGPDMFHAWVKASDVQIHDTWHVAGLRGTGSHDISAKDVFVPDSRVFRMLDPSGHRPEPLYRLPPFSWFTANVGAVSLGIARGALDEVTALAQKKVPTMSQSVLADHAAAQIGLARTEAQLGAARAFLYATLGELWRLAREGGQASPRQIAQSRMAAANAAETGAIVARAASLLGGANALYDSSALQRYARDADALAHHFSVSFLTWEDAGRVLMGRQPLTPVF